MKVWCHAGNPQVACSILCKAPTPQHSAQGAISATMAFSVVCITNDQNDVIILDICKNMCCFHFDHGAYSWLKKVRGKMDVCFERLETVTNLHQIMPSKGSTRHSEAPCLPRPGFPIVPFWTAFIKFVTYEIWSLEIFSPSHTDDSWKGTARTDLLERNAKKKRWAKESLCPRLG